MAARYGSLIGQPDKSRTATISVKNLRIELSSRIRDWRLYSNWAECSFMDQELDTPLLDPYPQAYSHRIEGWDRNCPTSRRSPGSMNSKSTPSRGRYEE